ncbi:MAG: guanylate kinase [Firmicutes bacterium]|nr:guanylate kinase [Bacillota bacterium]
MKAKQKKETIKKGLLIIISGPSGSGKSTIYKEILSRNSNILGSISVTTREPRGAEIDGVHYYFITKEKYFELKETGGLLEGAKVYGNYYGTPLAKVQEQIENGKDIVFEIDIDGARQIKSKYPNAIWIFVIPPSLAILEERLRSRATDTAEVIERRLSLAKSEIAYSEMFDYFVVNDGLSESIKTIEGIIEAERHKAYLMTDFIKKTYLD